jgi:hypothetical protein
MPNFPTQRCPVRRRRFPRREIPAYFWTEYIKSHSEDISLTWFDIGEPLLIHSQPNQIANRRYGVCTLLIPALGTRLVRNGIEAKGQSASDNHCAINQSIDVQRHGVNQISLRCRCGR